MADRLHGAAHVRHDGQESPAHRVAVDQDAELEHHARWNHLEVYAHSVGEGVDAYWPIDLKWPIGQGPLTRAVKSLGSEG